MRIENGILTYSKPKKMINRKDFYFNGILNLQLYNHYYYMIHKKESRSNYKKKIIINEPLSLFNEGQNSLLI